MRRTVLALESMLIVACSSPPYAPDRTLRGGYSDLQLSPDIFEVRVNVALWDLRPIYLHAISDTQRQRVADLVLLRAAELTLEEGSRYFVLAGDDSWHFMRQRASVVQMIKTFREKPDIADPSISVYGAHETQRRLRSQYELESLPRILDDRD